MADSKLLYDGKAVTSDDIYKMLLNFKGYGNPKGKFWFIGMEENWGSNCVEDITKILSPMDIEYYSTSPSFKDTKVKCEFDKRALSPKKFEGGVKRILECLSIDDIDQTLSTNVFITNVRFMPFTSVEKVSQLFGVSEKKYLEDEINYRENLFNLWNGREHLTFCLSAEYRDYFQLIFKNNESKIFNFKGIEEGIELYTGSIGNNIIFQLYHPSSRNFSSHWTEVYPLIKASLGIK